MSIQLAIEGFMQSSLGMDQAVIEAIKILGHFFLCAGIVFILRKMKIHPLMAFLIGFSIVSAKEYLDILNGHALAAEDLALNLFGAFFGNISA